MSVSTRAAATIVGMEYESFRTWLRRNPGLRAGMLADFCAPNASPKEIKRWTWRRHSQGSIGIYSMLRALTEGGAPDEFIHQPYLYQMASPAGFNGMNQAVSRFEYWDYFSSEDNGDDWLLLYYDIHNCLTIYKQADRHLLLPDLEALGRSGIIVNMGHIRRKVIAGMADALEAGDVDEPLETATS